MERPGSSNFPDGEEEGEVALDEAIPDLKEPNPYAVILHNDDYTTMEFVIEVLMKFFRKSHEEAMKITLAVHHQGRGVAGIFDYQIAETKAAQVNEYARANGHPLKASAEPMGGMESPRGGKSHD